MPVNGGEKPLKHEQKPLNHNDRGAFMLANPGCLEYYIPVGFQKISPT
jgi:hypothetical protein